MDRNARIWFAQSRPRRREIYPLLDLMDQLLGCLGGLTEYFQFIAEQL
jgi:hypothetical protein